MASKTYSASIEMTVGLYSAISVNYQTAYDAFSAMRPWASANAYLGPTGCYFASFNNTASIATFQVTWAGSYTDPDLSSPDFTAVGHGFADFVWEIEHYDGLRQGHNNYELYVGGEDGGSE